MKKKQPFIKTRVKKAQRCANFAGVLYWLGAICLAVFACLPVFRIDGLTVWAGNFWKPFVNVFDPAKRDYFQILVVVLYAVILITAVINALKCFPKLSWLSRRSLKYVNGYNKNAEAMEELGKLFSSTLATLVIFYFITYLILPVKSVTFTPWLYAVLGVGVGVHWLCGLIGGKISRFTEEVHNVVEEKRSCSLLVYWIRNLLQLVAVAVIVYFFASYCNYNEMVKTALSFKNPFGSDWVTALIPFCLQILSLVCIFVLITHATATTEFNHDGIEGKGMFNFRIFSFILFLTAGTLFGLDYFLYKVQPLVYDFAIIAGVALVAFVLDCILQSVPQDAQEIKFDKPASESEEQPMPDARPVEILNYGQQQPIYVPVYLPCNFSIQTQEQPRPQVETPAPVGTVEREEEPWKSLNPNKEWTVRCPKCGKHLVTRDASPYHRCPVCDGVFRLEKFQAYKRNPNYVPPVKGKKKKKKK